MSPACWRIWRRSRPRAIPTRRLRPGGRASPRRCRDRGGAHRGAPRALDPAAHRADGAGRRDRRRRAGPAGRRSRRRGSASYFAPFDDAEAIALANEFLGLQPSRDALTGVLDRGAFRRALAARIAEPDAVAVAILDDVDRSRLVNDTFGHAAGDALLVQTAAVVAGHAPAGAVIGRLGADEFGLFFHAPGAPAAAMACERLIHACHAPFVVGGHGSRGRPAPAC
ncbi:diguanylate cyclase domain-containing protein [Sphingomonas sp. MMS24-JH45]